MIASISNKDTLVREYAVKTMGKLADEIGAEFVINYLMPQLTLENPESRSESFKWINEHKGAISRAEHSSMVKPLVLCMTDKDKKIREYSHDIIKIVMAITGHRDFVDATTDMNTATKKTLLPILEKLSKDCGGVKTEEPKPA